MTAKPTIRQRRRAARKGRPTKLTPERRALILECARSGMTRKATAGMAHMSESTLNDWLGAASPHPLFAQEVFQADAEFDAKYMGVIEDAVSGVRNEAGDIVERLSLAERTKYAAWLLERRRPHGFSAKRQIDVRAQVDQTTTVVVQPLISDEAVVLLEPEQLQAAVLGLGAGLVEGRDDVIDAGDIPAMEE